MRPVTSVLSTQLVMPVNFTNKSDDMDFYTTSVALFRFTTKQVCVLTGADPETRGGGGVTELSLVAHH